MPGNLTIEEHEDRLGFPIVLLTHYDPKTGQTDVLRLRDLPLGAILVVIAWLNARLP